VYKYEHTLGDWTLVYPTTAILTASTAALYFMFASTTPALPTIESGQTNKAASSQREKQKAKGS